MITVGAAGHRVLADVERIRSSVDSALERLRALRPGERLTAMSALAEGTDRLVAEAILSRPDSRLVAVLPVPMIDYLSDFPTLESREAFAALLSRAAEVVVLDPHESRDASYEAAARHVLDRCDVLLAVWDGKAAQGKGGTGDTVARAREMGRPLIWIKAGNRKPGTMDPTTLESEQGEVVFENF